MRVDRLLLLLLSVLGWLQFALAGWVIAKGLHWTLPLFLVLHGSLTSLRVLREAAENR